MCASATLYGLVTISWPWYNDRNKVLFFWLLCSILKQEFTLVSVKVLGIYFHFGEYLLIIAYIFSIVCQCTYCFNVGFVERLITSLWLGRLGVHSRVSDIK